MLNQLSVAFRYFLGSLKRLSWFGKTLALAIPATAGLVLEQAIREPETFNQSIGSSMAYIRVMSADEKGMPLAGDSKADLKRLVNQLSNQLTDELKLIGAGVKQDSPWTIAQMALATEGLAAVDKEALEKAVYALLDPACNCWKELPTTPPHIGVTGWVVYMMTRLNLPVKREAVQFLLDNQGPEGWWPTFAHAAPLEKNGATYPTAWATLALNQYIRAHKTELEVDRDLYNALVTATSRSAQWLRRTKIDGHARWYDYPNAASKIKSLSLSGLVLFTLHEHSQAEELFLTDKDWMRDLEANIFDAVENEVSDGNVATKEGTIEFDRTRHIKLPWVLMATAYAYQHGTEWQKARALSWIEKLVASDIVTSSVIGRNWAAAELLIALRRLGIEVDGGKATAAARVN